MSKQIVTTYINKLQGCHKVKKVRKNQKNDLSQEKIWVKKKTENLSK